ncbi:fumarylacetoacetate hydrolase family protein [Virgibacillus sp. 179-BFC.A HS]|uniref:Fumarylacetoacetate hydrolase family protein n=1 Tax=Tigheibacillus jepli TaxID=3035914 RepID=A0ABU5CD24_9BACI|nr:fumarylacetoacetate hydrolase family protein [Virgibacillus sp. 179-BFC.A HS]MDY0404239.1 fumarylacetoacetate hydrolase family protein [Virgibacillus sp. 179-BFC.A HS]
MTEIKNIFCIGRNYEEHIKELHNKKSERPVVFSKPTHALAVADGSIYDLPANQGAIHYETEIVIKIARDFEKGKTADQLVDEMAIGLDLTLRDIQSELKQQGHPWLLAKGFPNSAILSEFFAFPGVEACKRAVFSLQLNGEKVQEGCMVDMIFDLNEQIDYIGTHFGLKKGDIIFTGTPSGVGPLKDGDQLLLQWKNEEVGSCTVHLA